MPDGQIEGKWHELIRNLLRDGITVLEHGQGGAPGYYRFPS